MRHSLTIIALLSAVLAGAAAWADDNTAAPATTQPAATQPCEANANSATQPASVVWPVTVSGVDGNVQVRFAEDKPWVKAQVGMKLEATAETRTGPRSAIRLELQSGKTITIDRLGVYKVEKAVREGGTLGANSGMKYGRTRYDIEAASIEHESTIRTPAATLKERSCGVSLFDQTPFSPQAATQPTDMSPFRKAPTTQPHRVATTRPAE